VLAEAPWYFSNSLHLTFFAAWTECDVEAGEFQHHFLQGMSDFE
jgi:hypothetical protein